MGEILSASLVIRLLSPQRRLHQLSARSPKTSAFFWKMKGANQTGNYSSAGESGGETTTIISDHDSWALGLLSWNSLRIHLCGSCPSRWERQRRRRAYSVADILTSKENRCSLISWITQFHKILIFLLKGIPIVNETRHKVANFTRRETQNCIIVI